MMKLILWYRIPNANVEKQCIQEIEYDICVDTAVVFLRYIIHHLRLRGASGLGIVDTCAVLRGCDNMSGLLHGQQIDYVGSSADHDCSYGKSSNNTD
jgi:hypothetical protein